MSANRELMERYWAAAEANDLDAMHQLRDEDHLVDFPQTGERLSGRDVVRASEEGHDAGGRFELTRLTGEADVWVAEGLMRSGGGVMYVVSISELRDGRVSNHTAGPHAGQRQRSSGLESRHSRTLLSNGLVTLGLH